jgi:hypothetical protein
LADVRYGADTIAKVEIEHLKNLTKIGFLDAVARGQIGQAKTASLLAAIIKLKLIGIASRFGPINCGLCTNF